MKISIEKNKGLLIAFVLFVLGIIIDFASTFYAGYDMARVLESNPLTRYVGFTGIIILNLGLLLFCFWAYKRTSVNARYVIIAMLILISCFRVPVAMNNIRTHERIAEEGLTVTEVAEIVGNEQKMSTVKFYAAQLVFLWLVVLSPFFVFKLDHSIKRRDDIL